jgi:acetylornithine aminotransferase
MSHHLMNTYAPMDVAFTKGEGAWLWDEHGKRYLDAISGLGVCALGHAHPELARVIAEQAATLVHTGNLVRIPWQESLADKLCEISGMDRVFFGNSGAEAIECALKITRLVGHQRGYETPTVAVMEKSFHGRTMAALTATGSRKVQAGFEPLVSGFVRAPFDNIDALRKIGQHASEVTAVLVEPIQGESGVRTPAPGYLAALRSLCDEQGWLLIFDEIQSGLCRSGRWYAHQHEDICPDILTTAKALANGLPIGACVARGEAAEAMKPGQHGSTFGGNPLVSRAACTVLDIMERDGLAAQAAETGKFIKQAFNERLGGIQSVREIRGRGLMIGIELDRPAGAVKGQAMQSGVIINVTQENVIRLLPPLIIDRAQAEEIVAVVSDSIEALE